MALGKIKVDTLEHSTAGSLDTSYVVNGSAKAWIDINSAQTSILASLNVSSFDDDGTGEGGANFTSNLSNAFGTYVVGVIYDAGAGASDVLVAIESISASSVEIDSFYNNATTNLTFYDRRKSVIVNGDLA